ncbi:DUF3800 domain-containing protein [Sphingomicrobium sp. XHP0235]|uniref:DUF3800 domain-containing protein n=1 Tax=Sphingomicrobium aquimarinum TaxID=3133971 RepID=UPI0031FE5C52
MYAFVDETGNTGGNIFDQYQPVYLTAALVTKTDFDRSQHRPFSKILRGAGVDEIHASVIGLGVVEDIALPVLRLLKRSDCRFVLSRVEKKYLLATKIFDTFFDSGENPAVPWHTYNVRPLRILLAFKVASLIDDEVARLFWAMLMEKSEARARARIPAICQAILDRIDRLPDERSRKVISDGLTWSRDHPEGLDFYQARRQAKNGHMPNMVGFTNLLDALESVSSKWKRDVRVIRHDRQAQFEATLAEWHELYSNALPGEISLPGETRKIQLVKNSRFEICAAADSPGIQVIDLILWLFKRALDGKELPRNSAQLLNFVMRRGFQNDFSFLGVQKAMLSWYEDAMTADLSETDFARAREVQDLMERRRVENMAAYEADGLMPFERQAKIGPKK